MFGTSRKRPASDAPTPTSGRSVVRIVKRAKKKAPAALDPLAAIAEAIDESDVDLDRVQRLAMHIVIAKQQSIFLTGPAGTGKSLTIGMIVRAALKCAQRVALTATTGKAAANLAELVPDGVIVPSTLHRFAGFTPNEYDETVLVERVLANSFLTYRWRSTDLLVIDEVSMLSPVLFVLLDRVARKVRGFDEPFGGLVMLLVGDFYQLPPVVTDDHERELAGQSIYCFQTKPWRRVVRYHVLLEHCYRQMTDNVLISVLNDVRHARLTERSSQVLGERTSDVLCARLKELAQLTEQEAQSEFVDAIALRERIEARNETVPVDLLPLCGDIEPSKLFARNQLVDHENMQRLAELDGDSVEYCARYTASGSGLKSSMQEDIVQKSVLSGNMAPQTLELKRGAQVMLLVNLSDSLFNGSRGVVVDFVRPLSPQDLQAAAPTGTLSLGYEQTNMFADERVEFECAFPGVPRLPGDLEDPDLQPRFPLVLFDNGQRMLIRPYVWERRSRKPNWTARLTQVPLKLAWAISIHKSQGMSISLLSVDLQQVFASGQAYVALSRARSLQGLMLEDFEPYMVIGESQRPNDRVVAFYDKIEREQRTWLPMLLQVCDIDP